ncbi:hypothetical protein [Nonomuraea typhae]|uniref:hypothetical protein n=1 Tax=Nonomuraea typhae TaxID=2603600 RepID=UPI0012F77225|nr:hypothetical protein [Nonomuraea typhae]
MKNPLTHLVYRLPLWVQTQPLDTMFALLGIVPGIASLTGIASSRALALMPWWAGRLWGLVLLVGSVCWLVGAAGVRERDGLLVTTRRPLMVLGLRLLSLACLIYGVSIIAFGGLSGLLASYPLVVGAVGLHIRKVGLTRSRL